MGQMQTKILARLREQAEASGLDFVEQPDYGNTGTVYVQADDFDTVVEFRYDFQNTYATVKLSGAGVTRSATAQQDRGAQLGPAPARDVTVTVYLKYGERSDMARLFTVFGAILTESGYPVRKAANA